MPNGSSNNSRETGKLPATSSSQPNKVPRPGLPEGIVGLIVFSVVGFGGGSQLSRLGLDSVVYGLVFTALSGVAGAVYFLRDRPPQSPDRLFYATPNQSMPPRSSQTGYIP